MPKNQYYMAHKDKIIANLKAKHPKVQGSVINFIADKLDPKVTTEAEVDTVIQAFEDGPITVADIAAQITTEGDRRVTQALKDKDKKPEPAKPAPTNPAPTDPATPPDPLAQVLTAVQGLVQRMDGLEATRTKETLESRVKAKAEAEKIPPYLIPTVEKEEDIDAAIETGKTRFAELKQSMTNEGLAGNTPPGGGAPAPGKKTDVKAVDADITGFVKTQMTANGIKADEKA